MIKELKPNQVFVFGSNTQGRHGKGAAKQAMQWGAVYGIPAGHHGQTYAIVTKELDKDYPPVKLEEIQVQLEQLARYAKAKEELEFLLTPVGTGLGGFTLQQLESIMPEMPNNVVLLWESK